MSDYTEDKIAYGRRNLDLLPGIIPGKDGRLYFKASSLVNLNQQALNLAMLMDSARSIMAERELDSLLVLIMDSVTRVMNADRSTLFLIDERQGQIWSRVAQGSKEIRVPLGEGIAGHSAKTGETVNIADAYQDPRFNSDFDVKSGYRTKSILCMPTYNPQGSIIGVIQVLNKMDGASFNAGDEELLGAFNSLAGISLANAQAYEDLEKERDLLEVRVHQRTRDLEESRKKSDELLLNILPASIADELKENDTAAPRFYPNVSVMFTDFKGFTRITEDMEPSDLIEQLNYFFKKFDEIVVRHGLEKIKTIGDSYMCAGGLPEENRSHAMQAALAALEIQRFMSKDRENRLSRGEPVWDLRLGIHSGPVSAGVVGSKKFAYDIWGDTVNTASRLESAGEAEKINVSAATYALLKDYFRCTPRGKLPAKNKGEIDMYFLEGLLPVYSKNGDGITPGDNLLEMLAGSKGV